MLWESRYKIYRNGTIYDIKKNKFQKLHQTSDGYLACTLRLENLRRKTFRVHRLVALSYIENQDKKLEVNHKDGNKLNNNLNNLEWVTHSENIQHAWDNGLIKNTLERKLKIRDKQGKKVINLDTNEVFDSLGYACEKYNINKSNLSAVCLNKPKYKTAGGFRWELLENKK